MFQGSFILSGQYKEQTLLGGPNLNRLYSKIQLRKERPFLYTYLFITSECSQLEKIHRLSFLVAVEHTVIASSFRNEILNGNITRQFGLRYEGIFSLFEFLRGNLDDLGPSRSCLCCLRSSADSFTGLLVDLNIHSNRAFYLEYLSISDLDPVWEECPGAERAGDQLLHVSLPDGAEAVAQTFLL